MFCSFKARTLVRFQEDQDMFHPLGIQIRSTWKGFPESLTPKVVSIIFSFGYRKLARSQVDEGLFHLLRT